MILRIRLLILFIFIATSSYAQFDSIFTSTNFKNATVIFQKALIPESIIKEIELNSGKKIQFADTGESWQASDNYTENGLAERKLLFFIETNSFDILYYKHGGRGVHKHCIVIINRGKTTEVKSLYVSQTIKTSNELMEALINKQYSEIDSNMCEW
jgi:hypothetical protein